jgi:hypothetical protein
VSYKPWKALERRHAKRMGGARLWRPDYSDSQPDGETDLDTWDAKAYAVFTVHTIFSECEAKYREFTGKRRFHLVLFSRRHPRVGDLVVLRADDYAALVEASRRNGDSPL